MKKTYLLLLILFLSKPSIAQFNFTLKINTTTLDSSTIIFHVLDNKGIKSLSKDTLYCKNKSFNFKGKLDQPSHLVNFYTFFNGKKLYGTAVIDTGVNNFNLDFLNSNPNQLTVSNINTLSNTIRNGIAQIFYNKLNNYKKTSGLKNAASLPSNLDKEVFLENLKYLENFPNAYYSLITLYGMSKTNPSAESADSVLKTLSRLNNGLQSSILGKQIYNERTQFINDLNAAKEGKDVLKFEVKDSNGKLFSNNLLKGQNYILAFSATWCVPCQYQLPKLKKIYDKYKKQGLKVVYFNDDDNVTRWVKHIQSNQLDWINVSERLKAGQSKIRRSFGVYAIPTYLIINKNGKISYNSDQTDPELKTLAQKIQLLYN